MREMVLVTTDPLAGAVMMTETPVAEITSVTGRDWGEFVAPDAEIVPVAL